MSRIKDAIAAICIVLVFAFAAGYYSPPQKPESKSALRLECLGHQANNICRVRLKETK